VRRFPEEEREGEAFSPSLTPNIGAMTGRLRNQASPTGPSRAGNLTRKGGGPTGARWGGLVTARFKGILRAAKEKLSIGRGGGGAHGKEGGQRFNRFWEQWTGPKQDGG